VSVFSRIKIRALNPGESVLFQPILESSAFKRYQYIRAISEDALLRYHLSRLEAKDRLSLGAFDNDQPLCVVSSGFLPWDSEVLGIPCARIGEAFHSPVLSFHDARSILQECVVESIAHWRSDKGIVFADARSDARDLPYVQALERTGFGLMESSIVYAYNAQETRVPEGAAGATVRAGQPKDLLVIDRIARALFTQDRFHRDPRLPDGAAHRLYEKWLENTLSRQRGGLAVLEVEGRIAGFHTGYLDDEFNRFSDKKVGIYDLIAVIPNPRFLKAWETIIAAITRAGLEHGATIGEGRTQVHNIGPMFRLLRLPPSYTRSEVTLHWWADDR
jgi:hypothetical protein